MKRVVGWHLSLNGLYTISCETKEIIFISASKLKRIGAHKVQNFDRQKVHIIF